MDCSTPGFSVHYHLPELAQIHVHRVSDAIQPSHPLSSPSLPVIVSIVTPCICHEVMVETLSAWLLTPHHGWPRFQLCFRCLGNWLPFHCWLLAHWSCPWFGDFHPPSLPPPNTQNQAGWTVPLAPPVYLTTCFCPSSQGIICEVFFLFSIPVSQRSGFFLCVMIGYPNSVLFFSLDRSALHLIDTSWNFRCFSASFPVLESLVSVFTFP